MFLTDFVRYGRDRKRDYKIQPFTIVLFYFFVSRYVAVGSKRFQKTRTPDSTKFLEFPMDFLEIPRQNLFPLCKSGFVSFFSFQMTRINLHKITQL